MIQALHTAIAGLRVSAQRLGVAAENIANVQTSGNLSPYDGYVPQRLEQTTTAVGTPTATAQPISQASFPVYSPADSRADAAGLVGYPNVDLAANIVDMTIAQRSYEANLVTLRTASDMMNVLLDRTA
ncbi:MAG: flagellar biosynthesis protein FlgC [Alphaproteobacteria bacterium]|nr:flagellar biosynthesis protein FlgC [Alphaproteobacteria bacterium]